MPTYLAKYCRENRRLEEFLAAVCGLFLRPERGLNPNEADEPHLLVKTQEGGRKMESSIQARIFQMKSKHRKVEDEIMPEISRKAHYRSGSNHYQHATQAWRTQGRQRLEENVYMKWVGGSKMDSTVNL